MALERKLSIARIPQLSDRGLFHYVSTLCAVPLTRWRNDTYLRAVLGAVKDDSDRLWCVRLAAADLDAAIGLAGEDHDLLARRSMVLLERLAEAAGAEISEVDRKVVREVPPSVADREAAGPPPALPVVVYVPHVRSPFNVGNIIRSAAAFGIIGVVVGPDAPRMDHPRLVRAAMGGERSIVVSTGSVETARRLVGNRSNGAAHTRWSDVPTVVLETGGTPVGSFSFPRSGVLVVGHEELGVPEDLLESGRRDGAVVTIPHEGAKRSLNVGVATGICLSRWYAATGATGGAIPPG